LKNKQTIAILVIIFAATLLRVWQLNRLQILFGDAARDLLVAAQSVQAHQIPLLGIPSSVPRFHQGPLTIWLEMAVYLFAGYHLLVYGLVFAFISVLAIILLYELLTLYTDKTIAALSAFFLAFSPLAIAHGRVPYHPTLIPLALVIYLFALMNFWQKRKFSFFWVVLAFCFLFQFELANTPLFLLIPYIAWRRYSWRKIRLRTVGEGVLAVVIGLLPQLIYDFTHRFTHLGGFAVWVVYRIVAFFGYKQQHVFSLQRLGGTVSDFTGYLVRVASVDNYWLAGLCGVVCLVGFGAVLLQVIQKKKVAPVLELSLLATAILFVAYFIHSSPSEAYFPPFFIFGAIWFGVGIAKIWKQRLVGKLFASVILIIYASFNTYAIYQNHFFVDTSAAFNYGPSVAEQRQVATTTALLSHGKLHYITTQPEGKFETYFDNLRWMLAEQNVQEDQSGETFDVEPKNFALPNASAYQHIAFPTVDVYWWHKL